MINRKIAASLFFIAFFCIPSFYGTWAINKNNDKEFLKTENCLRDLDISVKAADPNKPLEIVPLTKNGFGTIIGYTASNINPIHTYKYQTLKQIQFINRGKAIQIQIHGLTELGSTMPAGVIIQIGDQIVYSGGTKTNVGKWRDQVINIPAGTFFSPKTVETDVKYNFDGISNNNADARRYHKFDIIFTVESASNCH